jgi:hypothetical protein
MGDDFAASRIGSKLKALFIVPTKLPRTIPESVIPNSSSQRFAVFSSVLFVIAPQQLVVLQLCFHHANKILMQT